MKLRKIIQNDCIQAFRTTFPEHQGLIDETNVEVTEATQAQFGHYQCNSAMKLSKVLGLPPRIIAEKVCQALPLGSSDETTQLLAKAEVAGPGFINLHLSMPYLSRVLNETLTNPQLGIHRLSQPQKVVVDFSSPNIAKEMHVGHLRSTIIGDALARLLEFLGYDVLRLNHIGDWGTQFGMLIAYLKQQYPVLQEKKTVISLQMELSGLMNAYKAAKQQFDADDTFKQLAQQEVVALQGGDPQSKAIWEQICTISRAAYEVIYDRLDIHLIERGESFYNPYLAEVVADFDQKGLLTLSNGAACVFLPGFQNRDNEPLPLIIQKSDGGYNYATTDLAALKHRIQIEKADWVIYVTDAGQAQHFAMVFEAAALVGYVNPHTRLSHVPFGLVLRADGKKFKTRSGETEKLIDLLDAGIEEAKRRLKEHNPTLSEGICAQIAPALGINAIKYADLASHRCSNYVFEYDKMLKFEGNTAAFLSYALVRILSIQRRIGVDLNHLERKAEIHLGEPTEQQLGLLLCQFEDALLQTLNELAPHRLTDYLFRLAEQFHRFFHDCRVEGSPQQNSRLLLCEYTARVLKLGFHLLGLKPIEQM